jgi:hypothetical protein
MSFRNEYFLNDVLVGVAPCPKKLEDTISSASRGLALHKADRAVIIDMTAGGKPVKTLTASPA